MHVSNEMFEILTNRWDATSPKDIDWRILNILKLLNGFKNVVTVFSCSGHSIEELKERGEEDTSCHGGYISFALNGPTYLIPKLVSFNELFTEELYRWIEDGGYQPIPTLEIGSIMNPYRDHALPDDWETKSSVYTVWTLRLNKTNVEYDFEEVMEAYWSELEKALLFIRKTCPDLLK